MPAQARVSQLLHGLVVVAAVSVAFASVGCASSQDGATAAAVDAETPALPIDGFVVAEPGVALAGQPSDEALRAAVDAGYRTVVNLRTVDEGAAGEALGVSALGMRHVHVPVSGPNVTASAADALAEVLDSGDGRPVLIHCASGQRAAGVYALYLARHRGLSVHEALDRGAELGLTKPAVRDAVHGAANAAAE